MRFLRASFAFALLPVFAGCGYVHFGRLPAATAVGDGSPDAYSNLLTEQKILKQELALSRREGDALRAALERGPGGGSPEVVNQLNETARELATLRASYAKLQAERASGSSVGSNVPLTELEEKLAVSLRNYTQLQDENARLRSDLERARSENADLASRLKVSTGQNEEAQAALAQLNTELLAQKEARARAEQASAALNTQLGIVMAARNGGSSVAPAAIGAATDSADSPLLLAKAPPAGSSAVAELRTDPSRIRPADTPAATATKPRVHVVQAGDTLQSIAVKYFQDPTRWIKIYAANNELLRDGRPLQVGMELVLPEN